MRPRARARLGAPWPWVALRWLTAAATVWQKVPLGVIAAGRQGRLPVRRP